MNWNIRKIDRKFVSSTLLIQIIAGVTAGLSSYFWGLLSSSETVMYGAKTYVSASLNESKHAIFLERGKTPDFPITVITVNDNNTRGAITDRRVLADIVDLVARYEPAAIGLDFVLDRPTNGAAEHPDDQKLLKILEENKGKVVLGLPLIETSAGFVPGKTQFFEKVLRRVAHFGIINVHHEVGEKPPVWRKTYLNYSDPRDLRDFDRHFPAFSFALYMKYKSGGALDTEAFFSKQATREILTNQGDSVIAERLDSEIYIPFLRKRRDFVFHTITYDELNADRTLYEINAGNRYTTNIVEDSSIDRMELKKLKDAGVLLSDHENEFTINRTIKSTQELIRRLNGMSPETRQKILDIWNDFYPYRIKDRIILIGNEFSGRDMHNTPLTGYTHKREHGVFLHARILNMLLEKEFIHAASFAVNCAILSVNFLVIFVYTYTMRARTILILFLSHFFGYIALNWLLFLLFRIHYNIAWFVLGSVIVVGVTGRIRTYHTEQSASEAEGVLSRHASPEFVSYLAKAGHGQSVLESSVNASGHLLCIRSGLIPESPVQENLRAEFSRFVLNRIRNEHCLYFFLPGQLLVCVWDIFEAGKESGEHALTVARDITQYCDLLNMRWKKRHATRQDFTTQTLLHYGEVTVGTRENGKGKELFLTGAAVIFALEQLLKYDDRGTPVLITEACRENLLEETEDEEIGPGLFAARPE